MYLILASEDIWTCTCITYQCVLTQKCAQFDVDIWIDDDRCTVKCGNMQFSPQSALLGHLSGPSSMLRGTGPMRPKCNKKKRKCEVSQDYLPRMKMSSRRWIHLWKPATGNLCVCSSNTFVMSYKDLGEPDTSRTQMPIEASGLWEILCQPHFHQE